jgi:hypothetical protein
MDLSAESMVMRRCITKRFGLFASCKSNFSRSELSIWFIL